MVLFQGGINLSKIMNKTGKVGASQLNRSKYKPTLIS